MPKQRSWYELNVTPINWHRAVIGGMCASLAMMAMVDSFYMMGITPFCFENYLGSLLMMDLYSGNLWAIGFLANLAICGTFGIFYGYFFEFVYQRSGARNGIKVGFIHAIVAAIALFPFFQLIESASPVEMYPHFGFFGSGLGAATPVVLLFSHLVFGATMGTIYGPVRMARVRAIYQEPEDTGYEEEIEADEIASVEQGEAA
jgi:hypothetical protein